MPFVRFYRDWGRVCLGSGGRLPDDDRSAGAAFFDSLDEHLSGVPGSEVPWAVKVPRNLLFMRLWSELFPHLRFVHLVRNGLDMAYSSDSNQLRLYGDLVLTADERRYPAPLKAIAYWSRANLAAAAFGDERLGPRYTCLRFEDLCAEPGRAVPDLLDRLDISDRSGLAAAVAEVRRPVTIDRWRTRPPSEIEAVVGVGHAALERFGYLDLIGRAPNSA